MNERMEDVLKFWHWKETSWTPRTIEQRLGKRQHLSRRKRINQILFEKFAREAKLC